MQWPWSRHLIRPAQQFHGPCRKLLSSVITVSITNLNALVWNSSSFTIWPQLTFPTILCATPTQDPAKLSHCCSLIHNPSPVLPSVLSSTQNNLPLQPKFPNSWHPRSPFHLPICEGFLPSPGGNQLSFLYPSIASYFYFSDGTSKFYSEMWSVISPTTS